MLTTFHSPAEKLNFLRLACTVLILCAATAIASPAQTLTTLHSFAGPPNDGREPCWPRQTADGRKCKQQL